MAQTTETPDAFRPGIHFASRNTWVNDPNGLVFHNGLYHLYFQNNPSGNSWGNMSWGHATSTNLLDWREHGVAIPREEDELIFSGSIVFDAENTSGLGSAEQPPLVAVYTSVYSDDRGADGSQAQSLASSRDGGYSWSKYDANPVLRRGSNNFRDPKVFRYSGEAGDYWVMIAVEAEERRAVLYRSADLIHWDYLSAFGPANATSGVWECPDLFELAVDGDRETPVWVLVVSVNPGGPNGGSATQYFLGDFDGTEFVSRSTVTEGIRDDSRVADYGWLDWGRDYYAAVSFSGVPDGRRLTIGWMSNWDYAEEIPSAPWRGPMSLVREITAVTVGDRIRLAHRVVEHGDADARVVQAFGPSTIAEGVHPIADGTVCRIDVELRPGSAEEFGLIVRGDDNGDVSGGTDGTRIGFRPAEGVLVLDRRDSGQTGFHDTFASAERAPLATPDDRYRLTVWLDHCSVEVFANDGLVAMTDLIFPGGANTRLSLYARGGSAAVESMTVTELRPTADQLARNRNSTALSSSA